MLISKSQIENTSDFMGTVLRLPFDQKFPIRKQVHTVRQYIDTASPSRHRSVGSFPEGSTGMHASLVHQDCLLSMRAVLFRLASEEYSSCAER